METNYEKLQETVSVSVGIPGMTATLVERTKGKAIYQRWDGVYEVFRIRVRPEEVVFNRQYPVREMYPTNSLFGLLAWSFHDKDIAMKRYALLPDEPVMETEIPDTDE
jgi:hypothetical protein